MSAQSTMPRSAWIFLPLAILFAGVTATGYGFALSAPGLVFAAVLLVILFGSVFAAVHHAEVIAHAIGEPFGTLLLTLAVTIIEVALIATITLGDTAAPALARDTVFAVVMIVCNGLVGICILIGGLRYREQDVQVLGANVYLSVLFVLATIRLVMPDYTLDHGRPGLFRRPARLRPGGRRRLRVGQAAGAGARLPESLVLLFLTFALSMLTFGAGRTNVLFGLVHMVAFAVFLFMLFIP
jgi:Ca2+/H+ antiporter